MRAGRNVTGLRARFFVLAVVLGLVSGVVATSAVAGPVSAAAPVSCSGWAMNDSTRLVDVTTSVGSVWIPSGAQVQAVLVATFDFEATVDAKVIPANGQQTRTLTVHGGVPSESTFKTKTTSSTWTNSGASHWADITEVVSYRAHSPSSAPFSAVDMQVTLTVLNSAGIAVVRGGGTAYAQSNGAIARVLQQANGRFSVVVDGNRGLITTFQNLSQNSLDRLAKNYGWTAL